ncbi:MAG: PQQ-dependent sugar dehydrogenase, partial [Burkholderiaceae bacterium]|nr:PQQ-dependent sugar dehydrogenase [Burkholderiaceae bacterium]
MRTHRSPFALTRLVVAGACLVVVMAAVAAPAVATPAVATPSFSKDITRAAPAVPPFKTRVLVENLEHPWSIAWLPNGEMLVTERGGALRRISRDFKLDPRPIEGLPTNIAVGGQGGLFDVIVHPDFGRNGLVFIAYAEGELSGRMASSGTAVARARLDGQR